MSSDAATSETPVDVNSDNDNELVENSTELQTSTEEIPQELAALSGDERLQQRLMRFGQIAPEVKKMSRALRFGTQHEVLDDAAKKRRLDRFGIPSNSPEEVQEKKKLRAERFHLSNESPAVSDEAKQKRIDRFGVVTPGKDTTNKKGNGQSVPSSPALTEAIKKRSERFGDISDIAKARTMNEQKAKRAERFKPNTSV